MCWSLHAETIIDYLYLFGIKRGQSYIGGCFEGVAARPDLHVKSVMGLGMRSRPAGELTRFNIFVIRPKLSGSLTVQALIHSTGRRS